jgi:photosystem II stability/assembly factor-like uncharacterized protein
MKLTFIIQALLLSIATASMAQTINTQQLTGLKLRNIGPAGMSGRVTAIDVDLKNDIIYIGAASGGVWKSASGGIRWEPIFDKQPLQSIGAIAVSPHNSSEIWAGTGEGNPRNSQNFGEGIYKSLDGGKNWTFMGLKNTKTIHRIVVHPKNPLIVTVAALGSSWGANPERGVFQTRDGGKTWSNILKVNDLTGCADLVQDPQNPNKMIAAMWEYERKPWTFTSGGKGSGIYITHDGGETWEKRGEKEGLPAGELGRCGIAIARSKPNVVYAIVEAKENAIYRSDDGGGKWQKVGQNGDRPFYYAEMYVDPQNENRLYNIYSMGSRSDDGGKSWRVFMTYESVHPDHHAFWIHPENPNYMIDGNDGGVNISRDMGASWQFCQNLPLGQFYHLNLDNETPYNIYGGLQDNGTWVGPSSVWKSGGIRNADWQEVLFGDGFDAMPRRDNPRYMFGMSQGGYLCYVDRKTGASQLIRPAHPKGEKLRYNWNAGLAQDPFKDEVIYYGSQYLHKSSDYGQTWEIISPDLTTNDTAKQHPEQSGGLTLDATNAENHCTILSIAASPKEANVIWVGTDDGNLQLTRDGGKTWTNLTASLPNCPKNAWFPHIEPSSHQAGEAFVIVNQYRLNDWKPYTYHTTDFGKTWTRIADERQIGSFCLSIVQDPVEPDLLFLGTDFGLYVSINHGKNWTKWANDFPSVPVADMKIQARDGDLVIATFGRALWILDDIRPLRAMARSKGDVLNKKFKIFDPADAHQVAMRSTDGERFNAEAIYEGQNKSPQAMFSIWNGSYKKDEKLKLQFVSEKGDTIRTIRMPLDSQMNRVRWGLNRKGVSFPSYDEPKKDEEPSAPGVLPGRYKVIGSYGKEKDSTWIQVQSDARTDRSLVDIQAKMDAQNDYMKMIEKITKSWNALKEADKWVGNAEIGIGNAPDTVKTAIAKQGKSMRDSISTLMKLFLEPKDVKGISRNPSVLGNMIFEPMQYLGAASGKPTQNTLYAVEKVRNAARPILEKVNQFFEKDWSKYQEAVEKARTNLSMKYEAVKID